MTSQDPTADFAGQEAWLRDQLEVLGLHAVAPFEREHVRPWATAVRVPTDDGVVWFKAHTALLAHEGPVTRVLARLRPDVVLEVLASDDDRCWLVTRDAGEKLRTRIAEPADVRLLAAAVRADETDGTAGQVDPLTAAERDRLLAVAPVLQAIAADAAELVPDSVEHSDLHDGNVFVLDETCRVGDFGDCGVTQPLASLVVLQSSLSYRLGLDPGAPEIERLYRAALESWTNRASMADLLALVGRIRPVGMLGRALTWRALISSIDNPQMREFGDGWSEWARDLLAALEAVDA